MKAQFSFRFAIFLAVVILGFSACKKDKDEETVLDPVANFTFGGANNFAPCKVVFSNTSSNATSYSWDFGNGQSSTVSNPEYVFMSGGTYNVSLTATNSAGAQNVINKTVTILDAPTIVNINSFVLTGYPLTTPDGAGWDFNDGPDLYFELSLEHGGTTYEAFTNTRSDVNSSSLPITFNGGDFPALTSLFDAQSIIALYDADSPDADDWMDGYYFTVRNVMPTNGDPYPSQIVFETNQSALKFTLNLSWE